MRPCPISTWTDIHRSQSHRCQVVSPEKYQTTCVQVLTLIESALFGHKKGAFTGVHTDQDGLVKLARKGTLFLDEVGELDLKTQKTFLRVLQEKISDLWEEKMKRAAGSDWSPPPTGIRIKWRIRALSKGIYSIG